MMKTEKTTLKEVLKQVEQALTNAIAKSESGVAYMYVCGTKCLSVSVENIDLNETKEATVKEDTK